MTGDDVAHSVTVLSDNYADKTVANAHGLLAAMLTEAVNSDLVPASPCRGIRLPRRTAHEEVELADLSRSRSTRSSATVTASGGRRTALMATR
jgi:hypothetical protein